MTKKTQEEKIKLSQDVTKKIKELNELEKVEDLIKDNKIEFTYKEKKYRVRKPNLKEKSDIRNKTNKKYVELLDDDDFILREQLISKLKKNGVDINAMDRKINELQAEIETVQVKLAPIKDKKTIEVLEKEIESLTQKQQLASIDIREYLEPCIETELTDFGNLYMIYTLLEKHSKCIEGDFSWVKVFDSYDNFLKTDDDDLIGQATYYLSLIIFKKDLERNAK